MSRLIFALLFVLLNCSAEAAALSLLETTDNLGKSKEIFYNIQLQREGKIEIIFSHAKLNHSIPWTISLYDAKSKLITKFKSRGNDPQKKKKIEMQPGSYKLRIYSSNAVLRNTDYSVVVRSLQGPGDLTKQTPEFSSLVPSKGQRQSVLQNTTKTVSSEQHTASKQDNFRNSLTFSDEIISQLQLGELFEDFVGKKKKKRYSFEITSPGKVNVAFLHQRLRGQLPWKITLSTDSMSPLMQMTSIGPDEKIVKTIGLQIGTYLLDVEINNPSLAKKTYSIIVSHSPASAFELEGNISDLTTKLPGNGNFSGTIQKRGSVNDIDSFSFNVAEPGYVKINLRQEGSGGADEKVRVKIAAQDQLPRTLLVEGNLSDLNPLWGFRDYISPGKYRIIISPYSHLKKDRKYFGEFQLYNAEDYAFKQARIEDSIEAYVSFLEKYPNGEYTKNAEDELFFMRAKTTNSMEKYQTYLSSFKSGRHRDKAVRQIDRLSFAKASERDSISVYEDYLSKYKNGGFVKEAKLAIETLYFQEAKGTNSISMYEDYLSKYKNGGFVKEAKLAIETLCFQEAKGTNSISMYEDYLSKYKNGGFVKEAELAIETLYFQKAEREDSVTGYDRYLKKYPTGKFARKVRIAKQTIIFTEVQKDGSISSIEIFLEKYSDSPFTIEAQRQLVELSFSQAVRDGGVAAYDKFINDFPSNSKNVVARQVRDWLNNMRKARDDRDIKEIERLLESSELIHQYVLPERIKEINNKLEEIYYSKASSGDIPVVSKRYLQRFPNGRYAEELSLRIDKWFKKYDVSRASWSEPEQRIRRKKHDELQAQIDGKKYMIELIPIVEKRARHKLLEKYNNPPEKRPTHPILKQTTVVKDEFETEKQYIKRAKKIKIEAEKYNKPLSETFQRELDVWYKTHQEKYREALRDGLHNSIFKDFFDEAFTEILYVKHGTPSISDISYDRDKKMMTVKVATGRYQDDVEVFNGFFQILIDPIHGKDLKTMITGKRYTPAISIDITADQPKVVGFATVDNLNTFIERKELGRVYNSVADLQHFLEKYPKSAFKKDAKRQLALEKEKVAKKERKRKIQEAEDEAARKEWDNMMANFDILGKCKLGATVVHREWWDTKTSSGSLIADHFFNAGREEAFIVFYEGVITKVFDDNVQVSINSYRVKQVKGKTAWWIEPTGAFENLRYKADKLVGKRQFYSKSRCVK